MSGTDFTLTPNLQLYKPNYDADDGQWGYHLNNNADTLDRILGTGAGGSFLPLVGGTMLGPLHLANDPVAALGAATKQYVDNALGSVSSTYLPLAGGAMTGPLSAPSASFGGLNSTPIGATTPSTGAFTTLSGTTINGTTINAGALSATTWSGPLTVAPPVSTQVGITVQGTTGGAIQLNDTSASALTIGGHHTIDSISITDSAPTVLTVSGSHSIVVDVSGATVSGFTWYGPFSVATATVGNIHGPTVSGGAGAATGTQPAGSLYLRTDGAVGSTLYVSAGGGTWNAVAGV